MNKAERERRLKKAEALRGASRSLYYVGTRLLLAVIAVALCLGVFIGFARLANAYILVNEGMAIRCEYILQDVSVTNLKTYFTDECLLNDTRLRDTAYDGYTVSEYNYSLDFQHLSVWPWLNEITVDVIETVSDITGVSNSGDGSLPPRWTPLGYRLTAVKEDDRWRINTLTVTGVNPEREPAATPDPNMAPLPMASPTPFGYAVQNGGRS